MIEKVKKIIAPIIRRNVLADIHNLNDFKPQFEKRCEQIAQQICQKFPKSTKNPDGYEPELEPMEKLVIELKDCMYQGEPKFNNALEADAHNWDVRELSKPNEGRLLTGEEIKTIVVGYSAVENGMGWTQENLVSIERIIAKTASIKEVEIVKLQEKLDGRWKSMNHLLIRCQQKDAEFKVKCEMCEDAACL